MSFACTTGCSAKRVSIVSSEGWRMLRSMIATATFAAFVPRIAVSSESSSSFWRAGESWRSVIERSTSLRRSSVSLRPSVATSSELNIFAWKPTTSSSSRARCCVNFSLAMARESASEVLRCSFASTTPCCFCIHAYTLGPPTNKSTPSPIAVANAGSRRLHFHARVIAPVGRARIGRSSRIAPRSSANSAALA